MVEGDVSSSNTKKGLKKDFKTLYPFLIALVIVLVTVAIIVIKLGDSAEIVYSFFSTLEVEEVRSFISSFGAKAPLIFNTSSSRTKISPNTIKRKTSSSYIPAPILVTKFAKYPG